MKCEKFEMKTCDRRKIIKKFFFKKKWRDQFRLYITAAQGFPNRFPHFHFLQNPVVEYEKLTLLHFHSLLWHFISIRHAQKIASDPLLSFDFADCSLTTSLFIKIDSQMSLHCKQTQSPCGASKQWEYTI